MKKRITIRDVAKKAKVNISTVSRVINNDPRISEETKNRVQTVIKEMGFKPNTVARALAGGKTNLVAVISPSLYAHFAVNALRGIESALIKTDYDFQIYTTSKFTLVLKPEDKKHVAEIFERILLERKADAVISISINIYNEDIVKMYKNACFPLVFIEGKESWGHRVVVDNISGTYEATMYLLNKGRKRIGFPVGHIDLVESQMERLNGYKKALKEKQAVYDKKLVYQIKSHIDPGEPKAILDYMLEQKVDAIMCAAGDWIATGIMKEAVKRGIKIPDDIALIGYDDLDYTESIGLTTVKQPVIDMGKTAFELAMESIKTREQMQKIINFKPSLIIRSTA
jgi:LacI family transcriptional regulator